MGVTRWCRDVAPVKDLPALGDCWRCDAAQVAALKPTLVIGSVPYKAETVDALLQRGLTFLAMNPRTLQDIFSDIEMLGQLVGREKRAKALARHLKQQLKQVARRAHRARRRPRVYCESWPKPLMLSPAWVEEMVRLAGGRFVPAGGGRKATPPEVLAAKPEVIVLGWAGCGMRVDARQLWRRPGWDCLPAVRAGRVYVVSDEALNTPGPPLATGVEWLAKILHPEIFGAPTNRKVARVALHEGKR